MYHYWGYYSSHGGIVHPFWYTLWQSSMHCISYFHLKRFISKCIVVVLLNRVCYPLLILIYFKSRDKLKYWTSVWINMSSSFIFIYSFFCLCHLQLRFASSLWLTLSVRTQLIPLIYIYIHTHIQFQFDYAIREIDIVCFSRQIFERHRVNFYFIAGANIGLNICAVCIQFFAVHMYYRWSFGNCRCSCCSIR